MGSRFLLSSSSCSGDRGGESALGPPRITDRPFRSRLLGVRLLSGFWLELEAGSVLFPAMGSDAADSERAGFLDGEPVCSVGED